MVQHQKRAVEFDLFHLDIGHRGRKHGAAIGLLADIADETLDDFATDTAAFDLREVDLVAFSDLANEAHVVATSIHYIGGAQDLCETKGKCTATL